MPQAEDDGHRQTRDTCSRVTPRPVDTSTEESRRVKILVADTSRDTREMLRCTLEGRGHEVAVTGNPANFGSLLEHCDVGLIRDEMAANCPLLLNRQTESTPYVISLCPPSDAGVAQDRVEWSPDDRLPCPVDPGTLVARIRVAQRVIGLQQALDERLGELADTLRRVQESFLLGECPGILNNAQVATFAMPAETAAGDFLDFHQYDENCFDVVIGDVMGKGVKAALFGAATTTRFLRTLQQLLLEPKRHGLPVPEMIVNRVKGKMARQLSDMESFVTICYCRFDLAQQRCTLVDGGHLRTIHFSARNASYELLEGSNMPLGFSAAEVYEQISVPFADGDVFVLYSDGITEAQNAEGEYFGCTRLAELVAAHSSANARSILARVREALETFVVGRHLQDDVTCVAIKIGSANDDLLLAHDHLEIGSDLKKLDDVRSFVHGFLTRHSLRFVTDKVVEDVVMAANEAVANVIRHALESVPGIPINVEAELRRHRATLRISHPGQPFDRRAVPPPALDGTREEGFGLFIIDQLMDNVRYTQGPANNQLITLEKLLGDVPLRDTVPVPNRDTYRR